MAGVKSPSFARIGRLKPAPPRKSEVRSDWQGTQRVPRPPHQGRPGCALVDRGEKPAWLGIGRGSGWEGVEFGRVLFRSTEVRGALGWAGDPAGTPPAPPRKAGLRSCGQGRKTGLVGDPLVRVGRPRLAADTTTSASCGAPAGRRGRRPRTRGSAPPILEIRSTTW